jgi:NADH-quinone oxidoreductase subunit G
MSVSLTIDGHPLTVPEGTLLVEAAKQLGIEIPVFCYHPKMEPVGMCRMCLVTVGQTVIDRETAQVKLDENGQPTVRWLPKPLTACTVVAADGMVVVTDSTAVAAERKAILEFLLTSHPLDCPVCDKGGECPLQDLTYRHGPGVSRFIFADKHHGAKHYPLGDLIVLDQERCILCARCTRFQAEIADDPVLAIENRGRDAAIVSYSDPPFDSHYSGNTTDICPVGALTTRDFRFKSRPWELTRVPSLCNLCGVGCNIVLDTRRGEIARIMPRQNESVNELWICDKGRFGHHYHESAERLTAPLVRRNGELTPATWEEALTYAAERLTAIREQNGAEAIGGIAGAHLANEDLYLFQKLLRQVIGSPNLDHRVGLSAAIQDETAYTVGVGVGTDLGRVGRDTALLVLGSDLDQEAPLLYLRTAGAARHGAALINASARPTKLDRKANHVLRYRVGTATHLVLGMLHVILKTDEATGRNQAGNGMLPRLSGMETLWQRLAEWSPERTAEITGVSAADIEAAAHAFGSAKNGIILYGIEAANDPALQTAITNLATVTDFAGRANNGVIAVLPLVNSRGAADLGILPHRLPGYQPAAQVGKNAAEMLAGDVKGLLIAGADPFAQTVKPQQIEFLMVQEMFLTPTANQADVVLPAAALGERDGTYTNLERWVQHFAPALPAWGQSLPDWVILRRLAALMGAEWNYASTAGVLAEMAQEIPLYAGMSYETLTQPVPLSRRMSHYIYAGMSYQAEAQEGMQWPTLAEDVAQELHLAWVEPATAAAQDGFVLVTPRLLYDGGTMLGQNPLLESHLAQPELHISTEDAQRLGKTEGDTVVVSCEGRQVSLPLRLDASLPVGVTTIVRNLPGLPAEHLLGSGHVQGEIEIG